MITSIKIRNRRGSRTRPLGDTRKDWRALTIYNHMLGLIDANPLNDVWIKIFATAKCATLSKAFRRSKLIEHTSEPSSR